MSTSFVQDQKHVSKTDRFVAIQPSKIESMLKPLGFDLVSLKTGKARRLDRVDHQTTIARYRAPNGLKINGLDLDLVFKVPHLYGALEAFLGTYRQICTNGLVVGHKFFNPPRIRHTGDALYSLETIVPVLASKHDQLADSIRSMQAREVNPERLAEFIKAVTTLRLGNDEKIVNVQYRDLTTVRRDADTGRDVFSVLNVVQENVMRYGLRYQTKSTDANGVETLRNMTARPVSWTRKIGEVETSRSVDLNASIWDKANEILMAA